VRGHSATQKVVCNSPSTRTDVHSDFLAPLLLGSARVTLSVVMEPLGPEKAVRKVEASRTADLADAEFEFDHPERRSRFVSDRG
jgi:hypothetical protein